MSDVAEKIYENYERRIRYNSDRFFALLMVIQFGLTLFVAFVVSPNLKVDLSLTHSSKYPIIFMAAITNLIPALIAYFKAGTQNNKYIVAIGQMLSSALLVYLTGGRVETHFHAFGSLAFLAVYRDWRVIVTATVVFTMEHLLRGGYYPPDLYHKVYEGSWRWIEHTAWIIFEDIFLLFSIHTSREEMKAIAKNQAVTVINKERIEDEVKRRVTDLEEFTYVLSHDLKSSIRGIDTLVQWLSDDVKDRISDDNKENMVLLQDRVRRMTNFLEAIISYSRVTQSKYRYVEIDSDNVVEQIINECKSIENCKFIILNQLPRIQYHLPHLQQIFKALLHNSFTHNPDKKLEVLVDCVEEHDKFTFQVKDNGAGIDPVHHARIFKAFQILESRDKTHDLGMGLPFIKKIIEHHGGTIKLISELGQGAEFRFTVPKVFYERDDDREFMHK